ncbi:MAG: stage II sporulation protein M [Candidatus Pacearchaeota archaeon]|jgi:stage II sporulation protein M
MNFRKKKEYDDARFSVLLVVFGILLLILESLANKGEIVFNLFMFVGMLGFVFVLIGGFIYFNSTGKRNFTKSWDFIKKSRNYILFVVILLLIFGFIGFVFQPPALVEMLKKIIQELLDKANNLNFIEMFWFIFRNNVGVAVMSIVFGIVFAIFPILTIISNGYMLGFVANKAIESGGIFVIWKLFPHGIFELPAIIISLAFGIKLGLFLFSKNPKKSLVSHLMNAARVFFFIIVPLLLIAALIETSLIFLLG